MARVEVSTDREQTAGAEKESFDSIVASRGFIPLPFARRSAAWQVVSNLGPKIAGRYTLDPVNDPEAQIILLATGTGEAPHTAMLTELLRKGSPRADSFSCLSHVRIGPELPQVDLEERVRGVDGELPQCAAPNHRRCGEAR